MHFLYPKVIYSHAFLIKLKMPEGSAINEILQMRQQGLSNNQIIQNLQRQGYTNTQIFDAMNHADTKMAVEGMQPATQIDPTLDIPDTQANNAQEELFTKPLPEQSAQVNQPLPDIPSPEPQPEFQRPQDILQDEQVKIEELVEAIIEEKWDELLRDVNKIVQWKNKLETRVSEIEIRLDHLKDSYTELQKAIVGKVGEYDKHILEIGSEIKAMEKVFSKVLPAFTENVNELSKIANKLKEGEDYDKKSSGSS